MRRFTGYLKYPDGGIEEIDVDAETMEQAWELIEAEAAADYNPGYEIHTVIERFGLYM